MIPEFCNSLKEHKHEVKNQFSTHARDGIYQLTVNLGKKLGAQMTQQINFP